MGRFLEQRSRNCSSFGWWIFLLDYNHNSQDLQKPTVCPTKGHPHKEIHSMFPRHVTKMQIAASCCKNSYQIGSFVINGFFCPFLCRGLLSIFSGVFHVCFSAEECLPCVIHPLPFFSKVVLVNESIVWLPATRISPLEIKQVGLSLLLVITCFSEIIRSLRGNVQDFIMLC